MATKKRIQDPNAPKRSPSAYFLYVDHCRHNEDSLKDLKATDKVKVIGEMWMNLSPSEKEKYEAEAKKLKDAYTKAKEEYMKTDSYKKFQENKENFVKMEKSDKKKSEKRKRAVSVSGYKIFMKEFSQNLTQEDKNAMVGSVMKFVGEKWAALSDEEKEVYNLRGKKETEELRKEEAASKSKALNTEASKSEESQEVL